MKRTLMLLSSLTLTENILSAQTILATCSWSRPKLELQDESSWHRAETGKRYSKDSEIIIIIIIIISC